MDKQIYLIRHGHIDTGEEKKYIGRTNLPLDTLGKEQIKTLQEYFSNIHIDAVFTSPLTRCLETTNIICQTKEVSPFVMEGFAEINMGEWENIPISFIKEHNKEAFEARGEDLEHFTPPKGESFGNLSKRVLESFDEVLRTKYKVIIIVAHAGVNRTILRHFLHKTFHNIFTIKQPYASVYKLEFKSQMLFACDRIL